MSFLRGTRAPAPPTDDPLHCLAGGLDFGPGLQVAARSAASASRLVVPENQDNVLLIDASGHAVHLCGQAPRRTRVAGWPAGHVRLAVLDGMGGHGHGRQAAEAVATGLLAVPACRTLAELSSRLDALHAALQARFRQPGDADTFRRPGTTLTLLEIAPGQAPLLYHVGDSRLYQVTADMAVPLTIDHVPATGYAMHGLLGAQEWWQQVHGEHRAQIAQAFILGNALANPQVLDDGLHALAPATLPPFLHPLADRRALALRPGALYLLATDGLWSCGQPLPWLARWPRLLAPGTACVGDALASLFDAWTGSPPPQLYIDNMTAIAIRFANENIDQTALPHSILTTFC
ncbi:protein phosphatase 2C domain-containing protein [Duganella sp. FT3S]|uniref:Protein phosphatase 2C domain-containing protein n=1 Tax=Rugamonas fusca TaxID=2758568 RepID=A0A7W2I4U0_9BURK|nr:protein phosphatase 2C domain-containing protein [Rugamonas fusca]MBA5603754.1 protein phosphatase 2C domain-containing protein [Rugamonas fusca]